MSDPTSFGPGVAALLGTVQGLTEFLPVSSSGHLVLAEHWLDASAPEDILFECLLHMGTLVAVIFHYRRDVWGLIQFWLTRVWDGAKRREDPMWGLSLALIVGTVITGVVGLAFEDKFKPVFGMPRLVGGMLIVTAALLTMTIWSRAPKEAGTRFTIWHGIIIGLAQGVAIMPGISRSGTTIAVALMIGIARPDAARLSFLMSIPAILGATLLALKDLGESSLTFGAAAAGFVTSAVVGYLALIALVGFVNRGRLAWFAPYCVLVGITAVILF